MDNRNILDIGSILADINMGTATKIGRVFHDKVESPGDEEVQSVRADECEDKGPIGDYEITYQELCHLLENIKQKWKTEDLEQCLTNTYYQRDLLYLYDRVTLDMNYLKGCPDNNDEWLETLLELKYEIRNLL